jgi:hypothetical protein
MSKLHEVRSLMNEALRVANDVDQKVPPELHLGLEQRSSGLRDQEHGWRDGCATHMAWPSRSRLRQLSFLAKCDPQKSGCAS